MAKTQRSIDLGPLLSKTEKDLLGRAIKKLKPNNRKHFSELVGIKESRMTYLIFHGKISVEEMESIKKVIGDRT
ncbi:hypothetical protein MASR1M48_16900 [Lactococcus petauri]